MCQRCSIDALNLPEKSTDFMLRIRITSCITPKTASNLLVVSMKIKQQESLLASTLGAHGAFYIFRSKLFTELEHDTINDDFILPMRIVEQGYVSNSKMCTL